ncbi:MAG: DUF2065 domain-containing protein [Pseudomonadota bacterium]
MASALLLGLAMALVLEGVLYALFPELMQKMIEAALKEQPERLRVFGLVMACVGVFLVWIIKA